LGSFWLKEKRKGNFNAEDEKKKKESFFYKKVSKQLFMLERRKNSHFLV